MHIIARPLGSDSFLRRKRRKAWAKSCIIREKNIRLLNVLASYSFPQILVSESEDPLVSTVHRSDKVGAPGFVNFITAVAYHFCPSMLAALTHPGASNLALLSTVGIEYQEVKQNPPTASQLDVS